MYSNVSNQLTMGRIILEVDQDLSTKWENSTKEQQVRLTSLFLYTLELLTSTNATSNEPSAGYGRPTEKDLQGHRNRITQNLEKHFQELDAVSKKAISNGLTTYV